MNLPQDWICYQKTNDDKYWDAVDHVMDLTSSNPEALWNFIKETLNSPDCDDTVISNLAAGPLEDLMNRKGKQFIDRVVVEARQSVKFNNLLGGVWESGIDPEVWQKIESIRKKVW
ncbi:MULTISPECIES: DUF6869 domain-containing protein [unclassified Lentimonas]|uniref:DUF6869 domain-containing protein n=1 Tax=unclassified Lentimonas TaxID=2630993 RepID=UPI00132866FB|nr:MULTISPECIES: hypothetical protein [unclassified Lentimonas]CAA6694908.1 Unannotated [Lentimonas sp. CC19]CAA6695226.1 Unannotated [Lentimonas sp. CC10]CAA7071954.1 Unannotated [Lentimonas sp. CC11]